MAPIRTARRSGTRAILLAAPLALLFAWGCEPADDGGYPRVVERTRADLPPPTHPAPPAVTPGALAMVEPMDLAEVDLPEGVDPEMVAFGQQVYGRVCVACHAAGGAGTTIGPALDDQDWLHITGDLAEIVEIVRVGVPQPVRFPAAMPPMGGVQLDDDELQAVSAYVYVLSRADG